MVGWVSFCLSTLLFWQFYLSLLGLILSFYRYFKKEISIKTFLYQNVLLPWFIFLNLTKTKIAWYLYPVIPQFAFYIAYTLTLIKPKFIKLGILSIFSLWLIHQAVFKQNLLTTFIRKKTLITKPHWPPKIIATHWWGEHLAMIFYFKKPLHFFILFIVFKLKLTNMIAELLILRTFLL